MGLSYDPWLHAERLGLSVITAPLPEDWRGGYDHETSRIILAPKLSIREARCTLAHEVQHAIAGDVPSPLGFISSRQERRADREAAKLLIDVEEYRRAEELCLGHKASIAQALNVTADVVKDWRQIFAQLFPN